MFATAGGISSVESLINSKKKIMFGEQFFLEENRAYIIPDYQREIRWSGQLIETLINDINSGSRFLGTILLSQNDKTNSLNIIDGQQRLSCITIITSILHKLKVINKEEVFKIENSSFGSYNSLLDIGFDVSK